jgi:SAM-dependent methyltransferase
MSRIAELYSRFVYAARDTRSRPLFDALRKYTRGAVLDVGGRDFFHTAASHGVEFDRWTTLEPEGDEVPAIADPRFSLVRGDGCEMTDIADASYDTVLSIQVIEHVFEPMKMVEEIARVLRPGGHAIFLVPQTSTLHLAPNHFYNFTRYWIVEAMKRAHLDIVELSPLGGRWSSTASHLFHFFPQSLRVKGTTSPDVRRPRAFYPLYPLMALVAGAGIPISMLLSLGDLGEEPNNHLCVARKP